MRDHSLEPRQGRYRVAQGVEAVKKSLSPVILSEAKNLHLFVFKKIKADSSLRSE